MNVHLVLTYHWYDEVKSGHKRIEYRSMVKKDGVTPSKWVKHLWDRRGKITTVTFARGYTSTTQTFAVTKIDVGPCPYDGWPDQYYRIHFKELPY